MMRFRPVIYCMILFLSLTGCKSSGDASGHPYTNIILIMADDLGVPHRDVFWRYRDQKAVRSGNMKMIVAGNDTLLFDLSTDVGEKSDIADANGDILDKLLDKLASWETEMNEYPLKTN